MKYFVSLCVFLISLCSFFGLPLPSGSEVAYAGYNIDGQLSGYTGLSGDSFSAWANPAIYDITRTQTGIGITGLGGGMGLSLFGGLPTALGNFGARLQYVGTTPSLTQIDILWARAISRWFSLGVQLSGGIADTNGFFSVDIGMVQRGGEGTGFGFHNWDYGVVLKNIGVSAPLGAAPWRPFAIGIGGGFSPIVVGGYELRLQSDLIASMSPFSLMWGIGVRNDLWEKVTVSAGYQIPFGNLGLPVGNALTAGLGTRFGAAIDRQNRNLLLHFGRSPSADYTEIELWYGIQAGRTLSHSIMLNVAWGQYDDRSPTITTNMAVAFSPNVDGAKDVAVIPLVIDDNDKLAGWEVEIVDTTGQPVRKIQSWQPFESRTLTLQKVWHRLTSPDRGIEVPPTVEWDGRNEKGVLMSDGVYRYRVRAKDMTQNESVTPWQTIVLDTQRRVLLPDLSIAVFSPNNDGNREELVYPLTNVVSLPGDRLRFTVRDRNNAIVHEAVWTNEVGLPSAVSWSGKGNDVPLPEGVYTASLSLESDAGNRAEASASVRLVTTMETVSTAPTATIFSAARGDVLTVTPNISSQDLLTMWNLVIMDAGGRVVREISGRSPVPTSLVWDGRDGGGRIAPDGMYTYEMRLVYESGNQPISERQRVQLDNTPPTLTVRLPYTIFSPIPDSLQRTLPVNFSFRAETNDTMALTIVDERGSLYFYDERKVAEWTSPFEWSGLDSRLNTLPEGRYRLSLEIKDAAGHRFLTNIFPITLRTGRELISVTTPSAFVSPRLQPNVLFAMEGSPRGVVNKMFTISDATGNVVHRVVTNQWMPTIPWSTRNVRDGIYTYQARILYDDGQNPESTVRRIEVDNIAPVFDVSLDRPAFSPNNDGRRDTLHASLSLRGQSNDLYEVAIFNARAEIVRRLEWRGPVLSNFIWNGKDNAGRDVSEGMYFLRASAIDAASNTVVSWTSNIYLARAFPNLSFEVSDAVMAPTRDALVIRGSITETNRIESNELLILNQQGDTAHRMATPFWTNMWAWRGETAGARVPDGYYTLQWNVSYLDGNYIRAEIKDIVVDSQAPRVNLSFSPAVFTPDNDGENDLFEMRLGLWDLAGLTSHAVTIAKIRDNREPLPIKQWRRNLTNATSLIEEVISWNGIGDDRDLVESVQDYQITLTTSDILGHHVSFTTNFTTGVLIERLPEGLRIRMSSIQFAINAASLVGRSRNNLDKVIGVFQRLFSNPERYGLTRDFRIEVSGHTDDLPGPTADFNQRLSERRARTVYDYLVGRGIPANRLNWVGHGPNRPYRPITADMTREQRDEHRSRNRRVEFFIRK